MSEFSGKTARGVARLLLGASATAIAAMIGGAALAQTASGTTPPASELDAVVVTGSSLRGVAPVGSSVTSIGREAIENTAGQTGQQILQTVPAVSGLTGAGQGQFPNYGAGLSAPVIHGLGQSASNQTLVVIDGHRLPYMGLNHTLVDPNVVPPIALQRVEVLADGASAVYGSDAVAGVINFVTRNAYQGVRMDAQAGFGDHYDTRSFGALAGHAWDSGFVWAAYNYQFRSNVRRGDRPYTLTNHLAQGGTNLSSYNCGLATIRTTTGAVYPAPYTSTVPATGAGMCDATGVADLIPEEYRHSLMAKVRQEVSDSLTVNADILYSRSGGSQQNARGTITSTITTANPYFQSPVAGATSETVLWDATDLLGPGAKTIPSNEVFTVHPNVTYKLFGDWEATGSATIGWDLAGTKSIGALNPFVANLALNGTTNSTGSLTTPSVPGTSTIVTQTLTTANALDVFRIAGNRTPASVIAALTDSESTQRTRHTLQDYSLVLSGSVFDLPAGSVKLAVGAEYILWGEKLYRVQASGIGAASAGSSVLDLKMKRNEKAVFAEIQVPVVSPEMGILLVNRIDVNLSGRYDKYSDVGGTSNPKVGVNWELVPGLKLRGAYATSFTAPMINSLGQPIGQWGINGESGLTNYNLGAFTVPYSTLPEAKNIPGCNPTATSCVLGTGITGALITGGNRFLVPQTGKSWSFGVDFLPKQIEGLAITATFWNNEINGGITSGNPTVAVNSPALTKEVLTLYPTGATSAQIRDLAVGLPQTGALPANIYFLYSFQQRNLLNLRVQGIDYSVNYRRPTGLGDFTVQVSGSYLTKFDQQIGAGTPFYSVLNTTGANGTFPSIQFSNRAALLWDGVDGLQGLSAQIAWKHTGSYRNWSGTTVIPNTRNTLGQPTGGGDKVAANNMFDLNIKYELPQTQGFASGTQVYVDVQNIADKKPPFYNTAIGYDIYSGNPIGRVVSVGVRKNF